MNSPAKLTDTQLMVLSAASQREDRRVIMPDKLRGGAASKLLATLTAKGMTELVAHSEKGGSTRAASPAGLTNYRISAQGLTSIGVSEVEPVRAAAADTARNSRSRARRVSKAVEDPTQSVEPAAQSDHQPVAEGHGAAPASNEVANLPSDAHEPERPDVPSPKAPAHDAVANAADSSRRPPRAGSKLDRVIVLLSSETGATIDEVIALTGWLPHTARAALTGLRHRGYDVRLERRDKTRGSVYRVVFARAIAS